MDIPVSDAKGRLLDLVRRAEQGEEVVLTRHGKPAAKIVPAVQRVSIEERRTRRRAALEKFHGSLKGKPGFEGVAAERVTDFLYDDRTRLPS